MTGFGKQLYERLNEKCISRSFVFEFGRFVEIPVSSAFCKRGSVMEGVAHSGHDWWQGVMVGLKLKFGYLYDQQLGFDTVEKNYCKCFVIHCV